MASDKKAPREGGVQDNKVQAGGPNGKKGFQNSAPQGMSKREAQAIFDAEATRDRARKRKKF